MNLVTNMLSGGLKNMYQEQLLEDQRLWEEKIMDRALNKPIVSGQQLSDVNKQIAGGGYQPYSLVRPQSYLSGRPSLASTIQSKYIKS